jgi:hypothetical protein
VANNGDKVNEVMLAEGLQLILSQQIEARYSIKNAKGQSPVPHKWYKRRPLTIMEGENLGVLYGA